MAELLVRVVDKINADPYLDAKCTKRGDVIVVQPDGWVWGKQEQKNPAWRIVKLPGVPVTMVTTFLSSEPEIDPLNPSMMLQARGFKLDLDNLPASVAAVMADVKRRNPTARTSMSAQDIAALKIQKPPLADPNVFD
jgi:hypothetical protein